MTFNRRDFILGAVGVCVGGAVATATGLGYYYVSKGDRKKIVMPIIEDDLRSWVLTDDDFKVLEKFDTMPKASGIELLDNTDILGARDFEERRVASIQECLTACEKTIECNAFTYARLSHPIKDKRHMCWLKGDGNPERIIDDVHYISGIKR